MSLRSTSLTIAFLVVATLFLLGAGPTPPKRPAPPVPPGGVDHVFFFSSGESWLGVQLADITAERARALGMKEEAGAEIRGVLPDSPAAAAGLKEGDAVVEYQGTRIQGVAQLTRMVRETPAGRTVKLQILRNKMPREISVKVSGREEGPQPGPRGRLPHVAMRRFEMEMPEFEIPEMMGPPFGPMVLRLGAQVEDLNDQLGAFFGVKNGEGVLVRSVRKGASGEAAGLRAGDVIVRVGDEKIADHADLRSALRDRSDEPLELTILRERRETTLKLAAPKASSPSSDDEGEDDEDEGEQGDSDHDAEQI